MVPPALSSRDLFLALAVVAVWGTNFVVIREGLDAFPAFLFATLRFGLAFVPAAFVVRRPTVAWRNLAGYGLLIGAGQFGLLFYAMEGAISPGLASLGIQMQVFFTIGLSMALAGERLRWIQAAALGLGLAGLAVIALHTGGDVTPIGIALVLAAAASWAIGNVVSKMSGATDMVAYVVWSSVFAVPPLLALSLLIEGGPAIVTALTTAGWSGWAALAWQSFANTLFGYTIWSGLLSRYPAATVTPTALLVPVFGLAASALWLGEPLPGWKIASAGLILAGLALGLLYPRWWRRGA